MKKLIFGILASSLIIWLTTGGPRIGAKMNRIIDQVIEEGPPELITGEAGFVKPGEAAIWMDAR